MIKNVKIFVVGLILTSNLLADCESSLKTCKELIEVSDKQITNLHTIVSKQDTYIKIIEDQRDRAFNQLDKQGGSLPFWVWILTGVAGGVILTRGLR